MENTNNTNENVEHVIKFFLFSVSAGAIQAVTFTLLHEVAHLIYWPSYLGALTLSILWNFTLNRKFTFKSAANVPIAMMKVAIFYLFFIPITTIGGDALSNLGWNVYLILGGTMVSNFISEFLYTKYFVYKNQINTAIDN